MMGSTHATFSSQTSSMLMMSSPGLATSPKVMLQLESPSAS